MNFGFETSLDTLNTNLHLFNDNCLILCPLSTSPEGSLEQSYSLLQYSLPSSLSVLSEIMKTSFSLRIDKERQMNESLDADFFGTHQRQERLNGLAKEVKDLERQFVLLRGKHKEVREMQGLIKIPEVAKVLQEIGVKKK